MNKLSSKIVFVIIILITIILMLMRTMLASVSDIRVIEVLSTSETDSAKDSKLSISRSIVSSQDRELTIQTRVTNTQRNIVDGGEVGEGQITEETEVVIAIDNSYSMKATNDSNRIETAKIVAKKIVSALYSNKNVKFGLVTSSDGKLVSMGQSLDEVVEQINKIKVSEYRNSSIQMLQEVENFYSGNTNNKFAYVITDGSDAVEEKLKNMESAGIKITAVLSDITSQSYESMNSEEIKRVYRYDEFVAHAGGVVKEILGEQENTVEVALLIDSSNNIESQEEFEGIKEISKKLVSELFASVKNLKMSLYNTNGEVKAMGSTKESIINSIDIMEKKGSISIDNSLLKVNQSFTELTNSKFLVVFTNGKDGTSRVVEEVANSSVYIVAGLTEKEESAAFGTPENPTTGAVKYINIDSVNLVVDEIMEKINTYLHNDINNITITENFDSKLVDNFDIEIISQEQGTTIVESDQNHYVWNVPLLTAQATAILEYKIKIKDNISTFNRNMLNLPINTSKGITATYVDEKISNAKLQLNTSPKIKIVEEYSIIVQAIQDWDTSKGIEKVKFEIIGTNSKGEEIINIVSYVDNEGKIKIDGIREDGSIKLKIKERVVPEGHRREEEEKIVIINKNSNTGVITCTSTDEKIVPTIEENQKNIRIGVKIVETAHITVKDVNRLNNRNITGSYYQLVQPEGKATLTARTCNYYIPNPRSPDDYYYGGAKFQGDKLPKGEYTYLIKQDSPAKGYLPLEDFKVKITYDENGEIVKAIVEGNEEAEARIINKSSVDIVVKSKLIAEAEGTLFQVEINDVDADDSNIKIQNAKYVANVETLITNSMSYSATTNEEGKAIIENVFGTGETRIKYYQKSVPEEYRTRTGEGSKLVTVRVDPITKELSIIEDKTTVGLDVNIEGNKLIINETNAKKLVRNTLRVKAVDKKETGITLKNISFTITCPNGEKYTAITDASGEADINDIVAPGEGTYKYKIKQQNTPIDYINNTEVQYVNITFDENGIISNVEPLSENENVLTEFKTKNDKQEIFKIAEIKMLNEPKDISTNKFTINITETDSVEGRAVSGVVLKIETQVTIDGEISSKTVQKTTNGRGEIEYNIIDGDEIILNVQEIQPREGFVSDTSITSININKNESGHKEMSGDVDHASLSDNSINLRRVAIPKNGIKKTKTTFEIKKVTEDGKSLQNIEFVMQENKTGERWDLRTNGSGIAEVEGNNLPVFITNKIGKFEFNLLELEPIAGYEEIENIVGFSIAYEINDEGNIAINSLNIDDGISYTYILDHKYSQEYTKEYLDVHVELIILNVPNDTASNSINIEKLDLNKKTENKGIAGAEYDIFVEMPDNKSFMVHETTNGSGRIKISNFKFPEGKTVIKLTETQPAESYKWDKETKIYEVTCKDGILNMLSGDATVIGDNVNITLFGTKMENFDIEIDKVDSFDTDQRLQDAIFTAKITTENGTQTYERLSTTSKKHPGKIFMVLEK